MNSCAILMALLSVTFSTPDLKPVFVYSGRTADSRVSVVEREASGDSTRLEFLFENGPGRFSIPCSGIGRTATIGKTGLAFQHDHGLVRLYQASPENLEWELILDEPPASHRLEFPFVADSLVYFYQPPLTNKEIIEGVERPDSVIGSYAVYHAPDHRRRTRKAFHIYRPRSWDANGDTVWCGLSIDVERGIMTVDVPPRFLTSSTYPVTVDPTFGFASAGASTAPMANTVCYAGVYDAHSAVSGDRVIQFHGWLRSVGDGSIDLAVYSMTDGVPEDRLTTPVTLSVAGSGDVVLHSSSAVSQALVNGESYCVAMGSEVGDIRYAYDAIDNALSVHTSSGSLPQVWSEGATSARRVSIYVTYEEAQTSETPPGLRRRKLSAGAR